tara:strand:+ start:60 stop:548 length:489 start_codon:yes stop_codon:yes gene_type:complete
MKKLLSIIIFGFLLSESAYAETILLKCKFIDGKQDTYGANVIVKTTKLTAETYHEKEIEMRLNTALEKIIEAPYYGGFGMDWEIWQEDYIQWKGEVNIALSYDTYYTYNLDRVTGILSMDRKSTKRIVKNGHYQKDANGKWVGDTEYQVKGTYQCKKEERLF